MITQDINAMEKKPFESPEVKVIEITPRSIIAQTTCTHEGCPMDTACTHVACVYEVSE